MACAPMLSLNAKNHVCSSTSHVVIPEKSDYHYGADIIRLRPGNGDAKLAMHFLINAMEEGKLHDHQTHYIVRTCKETL